MSNLPDNSGVGSLALDRERVTCLLLINTQLMKKAINIYHNILCNQQTLQQMPQQTRQSAIDSYQNCTRRLHCNLTVLNYIHEKYHADPSQVSQQQNKASFPIILSAPQDTPELIQLYTKLQELYPEALQYLKMKLQQMRKSQFQNQPNQNQQPQQSRPSSFSQQQLPQRGQQMPQRQLSQQQINNLQQQQQQQQQQNPMMASNSPMLGNVNTINPQSTSGQPDFLQQQQHYNNGFNGQNQKFGGNIPQQQGQPSAISPQQILQQMNNGPLGGSGNMNSNLAAGNGNNNNMMDFF
ncbi:predicted protein [Scheffersomyces stipitis CBS 6054]|uniref:Uncharacterized protein n=1 Tax=Scheffersomyces stipitis (strain ATCC 58785 / CBS 6054 / NBRC 10063 / NRRL Y-11545) TaxID=322104 RepID=A3LWR3_PICST|nr:predicted protein [Scheffersomyces stipitis CBS 6054]ABN67322.2 predicted protein [Scheffersomyces stipitis CBS 6054]KAG2732584.1 hypothetical protein G9P44_005001 [Scheffersomyces stipitis]